MLESMAAKHGDSTREIFTSRDVLCFKDSCKHTATLETRETFPGIEYGVTIGMLMATSMVLLTYDVCRTAYILDMTILS